MKWGTADPDYEMGHDEWRCRATMGPSHLCQSRPNYLLFPPNQPGITAIISHCVFFSLLATFSVKFHFNWVLNFWSKSAKDPETYFMSEPERRCGLFACGRLHRIRISDEDSWGGEDREAQTADANHDSDIAMHSLFPSIAFKTITVSEQDLTERESQLDLFQKHPWKVLTNRWPSPTKSCVISQKTLLIFWSSKLDPWEIVAWLLGAFRSRFTCTICGLLIDRSPKILSVGWSKDLDKNRFHLLWNSHPAPSILIHKEDNYNIFQGFALNIHGLVSNKICNPKSTYYIFHSPTDWLWSRSKETFANRIRPFVPYEEELEYMVRRRSIA